MVPRFAPLFLVAVAVCRASSPFDEALDFEHKGRSKEARDLLRSAASGFKAAGDQPDRAKALSRASRISLALGDYEGAIHDADQAVAVRRQLHEDTAVGEDFNTLGLANLYLGNYPAALSNYRRALELDVKRRSVEGEVARLNNIGNVYYFQGRYADALRSYQAAMSKVNAASAEGWYARRRQLTTANLATLYQRLGKDQMALDLYRQMGDPAMPHSEQAQLLVNEGALYRRLGDPLKALERYRASQTLFATEHHRDGEIGALRNIGIVRTLDLNDLQGGLNAFTEALRLAMASSNLRGTAQARLYRAEALRRLDRLSEAQSDARMALETAQQAGLVEEQWKARYALGRIAEERGETDTALDAYQKAIGEIESIRTGLSQASLRTDFLDDKREVYDSLIALRLRQPATSVSELFFWMERSRARTLVERYSSQPVSRELTLKELQSRLGPDTTLLEYWVGITGSATLWVTASNAGIVHHPSSFSRFQEMSGQLAASIQTPDANWQDAARLLGNELLADVPLSAHLLIVPDGPLDTVPFEILSPPGSRSLLIEQSDVTYLPSTRFVERPKRWRYDAWLLPGRRELVAFGDPPVSAGDTFAGSDQGAWQRLTASADEIQGISQLLPGRSQTHLGQDARKRFLLEGRVAGVPLLHFSTHAVVDEENSDRSRILLAPDSPATTSDYLFEGEVYTLDLHDVDLTTVSACDTARGKLIRGEGVEAFSRAFLAAGSAATITSLWRAPDQSTADFMKQLYYYLARGQSKSEALRSAKLRFIHSRSTLAGPRYWAAFVLNGDGWNGCRRVISWNVVIGLVAMALAMLGLMIRRHKISRQSTTAAPARR